MSIVIKRRELVKLLHGLNSVNNVVGTKFAYAVNKSKKEINRVMKEVYKEINLSGDFIKYDQERLELCQAMAEKDENGNPKVENGNFVIEKKEIFEANMAELMDKYKDAIKEKEDTEKAFEEIEETLELHCIKFDDLPELTANQLESIESILI